MKMETHEHHELCPDCGFAFECASSVDSGAPVEGDLNLCYNCGVILIFAMEDGRLTSRHLTPEEIYERCTNPKWWMTQRMSRQIQERGPLPANPNDSKASH